MKHLKKFNENFNSDSNYKSLIGSTCNSLRVHKEFILDTNKGILNISCNGDNFIDCSYSEVDKMRFGDVKGLKIDDIQVVDDYTVYILFDNGMSLNVYDDNEFEGLKISVS